MFYKTQEALEKSDALYVDASRLAYDAVEDTSQEVYYDATALFPNAMRVNDRFLQYFAIVDEQNEPLADMTNDRTRYPTVYIPSSLWDEQRQKEIKQNSVYRDVTFVKIKDGQHVFAFDAKVGLRSHGFIENAVFVLDGNMDNDHYLIDVSHIPSSDQRERFVNWQKQQGLPEIYFFKTPYEQIKAVRKQLKRVSMQGIVQMILLLLAIGILSFQYVYMYIKANHKKVFVYKTFGASFMKRYEWLLVSFTMCYVFGLGVLLVIQHIPALFAVLVVMALDTLMTGMLLMRMETKSIAQELRKRGIIWK